MGRGVLSWGRDGLLVVPTEKGWALRELVTAPGRRGGAESQVIPGRPERWCQQVSQAALTIRKPPPHVTRATPWTDSSVLCAGTKGLQHREAQPPAQGHTVEIPHFLHPFPCSRSAQEAGPLCRGD